MDTTEDFVFDPFDPEQEGQPFGALQNLRERCPVAPLPSGMYYLSRYADILAAFKNNRAFINADAARAPGVTVAEDERFVSELDPPRHPLVRRLLLTVLSPANFAEAAPYIREVCEELVDAMVVRGEGDLVPDLAMPLPSRVITHLLGFPMNDAPMFADWVTEMLESGFIEYNRTARGEGFEAAFPEFARYIDEAVAERANAADPPNDVVTRLVHAEYEGRKLTQRELRSIVMSFISAGNGTTTSLIANLFYALIADPTLFRMVHMDRSLIPIAVEESLRRDPPVVMITRRSTRAVEIEGTKIQAGARVALGMVSANHDDTVYEHPEEFRLDRVDPATHVTFGAGAHLCLGAPLARLETATAVSAFMDRVAEAELVPESLPERMQSPLLMGFKSLPVRITVRA